MVGLCSLLFCLLSLYYVSAQPFFVEHVHLIQSGKNFLFRGGIPNYNLTFQYDLLAAEMQNRSSTEGSIPFPSSFNLVDLNLLNPNSSEITDIKTEQAWFIANSDKGTFVHYQIVGEAVDPFSLPANDMQAKAATFDQWSADKLPTFIEDIYTNLSTPSTVPSVYYLHCECGCDRTGEVSGSYYMRYMNMSFHDVHILDMEIAGREIGQGNRYAMSWYCLYLLYAKNFPISCEP